MPTAPWSAMHSAARALLTMRLVLEDHHVNGAHHPECHTKLYTQPRMSHQVSSHSWHHYIPQLYPEKYPRLDILYTECAFLTNFATFWSSAVVAHFIEQERSHTSKARSGLVWEDIQFICPQTLWSVVISCSVRLLWCWNLHSWVTVGTWSSSTWGF